MVGIHTPEIASEHGKPNVEADAKRRGLQFPIVVDDKEEMWSAWGNSMWPSVYLIDKQGYARYWWYGELNWQDRGGQTIMKNRIKELLTES